MKGLLATLPFFSDKRPASNVEAEYNNTDRLLEEVDRETGVSKYVSGLPVITGVDKYVDRQQALLPVKSGPSGVELYLEDRPNKSSVSKYLQNNASLGMSGVAKYLKNQPEANVSSVDKYVANRKILALTNPKSSGVENYLKRQKPVEKEEMVVSSVADYLLKNETDKPASSVAKYISKKNVDSRKIHNLTGVEKYQLEQEIAAKKEAAAMIVDRFLKEQAKLAQEKMLAEKEAAEIAEREARLAESLSALDPDDNEQISAVDRYVSQQESLLKDKPQITSVTRYVAKKRVEESSKPVKSSVEKYLTSSNKQNKPEQGLSGVAKYIKNKELIEKSLPKTSGVSRYLRTKSVEDLKSPRLSGVAKYLTKVRATINVAAATIEKSLEGEFIPAGQSRVDKYLEEKKSTESLTRKTRVEKYLDQQVPVVKETHVPTRVEMYIDEQIEVDKKDRVSGVEKYLTKKNDENEVLALEYQVEDIVNEEESSSVDLYLRNKKEIETVVVEKEEIKSLSGVERYMNEKAMKNATGVEKYLRNL